jgi:hypothetical protein
MRQSTIIGESIDPEYVALARQRLTAFAERHGIDLDRHVSPYDPRDDDVIWVHDALADIYNLTHTDPAVSYAKPPAIYYQAVQVFRRAIGHPRATFLHISNGRAYAAW